MRKGRIVAEISKDEICEENIISRALEVNL
jgi:hypothetical protein